MQTKSLTPWLPQLSSGAITTHQTAAANLPCTWAQGLLTCYCNVDLSRPRSELPVLRKRRDPSSSKWLEAKGVVACEVTKGWSSVNCLGSGEPFHIKCYVISAWQIWLQNISRLKVLIRITNPKYLTLWKDFTKFFPCDFLISSPHLSFPLSPKSFTLKEIDDFLPKIIKEKPKFLVELRKWDTWSF